MAFSLTRRGFFSGALLATPLARFFENLSISDSKDSRTKSAFEMRYQAALRQSKRPISLMVANGDEANLPNHIASFAKGLSQNQYGEVESRSYDALLAALKSQKHEDFERVPRGGGRRLNDPQAAFSFHPEGGDPQ